MNISEHLWFSAEHYWPAANREKTIKTPKKGVFFFIIDAEQTRNRKFQNEFHKVFFWKILKIWSFGNLYFPLFPCQTNSYQNKKRLKNTKINPANRRKALKELIAIFLECIWANLQVFCASNVHGWIRENQLCSGLNQYFSEMIAEKISYFQIWFNIVQTSSEYIRRSGITS